VGNDPPDHVTIARFRRRHVEDLEGLFTDVLKLCRKAGLLKVGVVSVDGSKIKANASLKANRTDKVIREAVSGLLAEAEQTDVREDLQEQIEGRHDSLPPALRKQGERLAHLQKCRTELQREQDEKARQQDRKLEARKAAEAATGRKAPGPHPNPGVTEVSDDAEVNVTDPESRIMKTRKGWVQGYNAQIVVTKQQIIVAAGVTKDRSDYHQLGPMLELAADNVSRVSDKLKMRHALGDAGYWSEQNIRLGPEGCELLIATSKDSQQKQDVREKASPRGRIPAGLSPRELMERKLLTKRGRSLYRLRGQTVEPVFGQLKEVQGAGQFRMRGLELCQGEWALHAVAHNLRKIQVECVRRGEKGGKWLR
jgi:hypothetical protein